MSAIKNIILIFIIFSLAACKITGEATDEFEQEDLEPKINLGGIIGATIPSKTKRENKELRERLERLEQAQQSGNTGGYQQPSRPGDLTSPPIGGSRFPAVVQQPRTVISPADKANFEEWKKARSKGSGDYREFKEYQEWLEFKKLKEQKQ